jgi:hypothetical protein
MSFLAPLFLLGALAMALPVVFHLIRRTTRERTAFSSLMFLLPTPPRLTRRSRLEHVLLLVLRCAVLALLALGFARPFFKTAATRESAAPGARRLVVLVDASASMRRENLWARARDQAAAILRQTSPADQVAMFTFGPQVNRLVTFDQWQAMPAGDRVAVALQRLAETTPGWSATPLGRALVAAAEALEETDDPATGRTRQIVLISDFQEGSDLSQLQAFEWPKRVTLRLEPVAAQRPTNAGLQLASDANERDAAPGDNRLRVRVSNSSASEREQFRIGWQSPDGREWADTPLDIYVPPGQSRIVSAPPPPSGAAVDRLVLRGDDQDFDNTVFVIPPATAQATVLYLGDDPERDSKQPLYFLQRAFQETRRQAVRVVPRPPATPLSAGDLASAALAVVTAALPEPRAFDRWLSDGRTVLFVLRDVNAAPALAALLHAESLSAEERGGTNYAMLAEIDFQHPLFAPFADPRYSDFTKIHFWHYRRLDLAAIPGARALATFDTGDPALVEVPRGRGRVLVLTSGWHPADSQLALSTKFVPLLYAMLDQAGSAPPAPAQFVVGATVPVQSWVAPTNGVLTVLTPDGSRVPAATAGFTATLEPGIYRVGSAEPPVRFAVNLDPAESRTAPLPAEELERLGAPVQDRAPDPAQAAERTLRLQNTELENRQKVWRWLIVAAVLVLLTESWLAGWMARRPAAPTPVTS